jgi:hypothetical protein
MMFLRSLLEAVLAVATLLLRGTSYLFIRHVSLVSFWPRQLTDLSSIRSEDSTSIASTSAS